MGERRGEKRKRSTAITLVLSGSLAGSLAGCGEPEAQRDVYTKLEDCTKDWGNPAECSRVTDGGHSSSYYYGPRYFGPSFSSGLPRPSPNALEATRAGHGNVTRMAGGGRTGSSSSGGSSSVSRSGFGSSGHSMSSGG